MKGYHNAYEVVSYEEKLKNNLENVAKTFGINNKLCRIGDLILILTKTLFGYLKSDFLFDFDKRITNSKHERI